ncbi:MAG: ATP-binding protein [Actinophytocola sp.]|uniref:ATP-binding protein n=1 Tax=Actinophytocola sp. TaxID=1872138 RepID=UPI003D6AC397
MSELAGDSVAGLRREALAALRFNSAETPDHVWHTSPYHVDGLHEEVERVVRSGVRDAASSDGPSPIGLVLQGQKGVGKTHLLGWVRREVQRAGGYFFLIELNSGESFWADTAEAIRHGFLRRAEDGGNQLVRFLEQLCAVAEVPDIVPAVSGTAPVTVEDLDALVGGLRRLDPQVAQECGDTARALVLYAATDSRKTNVGQDYLGGFDETDQGERRTWGIHPRTKPAKSVVRDISRLLALTGPTVIAVDQLDTLVAKSTTRFGEAAQDQPLARELSLLADGLMLLRETTRRTLSVVACLPNSWRQLKDAAVDTVADRFREAGILGRLTSPELGRALVAKWLAIPFERVGFTPPHPTWPVAPAAFEAAWDEYTPRQLLKRIDAHVESCLQGEISELATFDADALPRIRLVPAAGPEPDYFAELDTRFAELKEAARIEAATAQKTEDRVMPAYLSAALRAWITETGNDEMVWSTDPMPEGKSAVHAGLHRTVDEELDIEEHWAFRAIASVHHVAALHRLRNARSAAGIRSGSGNRHLVLIRNLRWSPGRKTQTELREFEAAGGRHVGISDDDLRTYGALHAMLGKQSFGLREWLVARKPASRSRLLGEILGEADTDDSSDIAEPEPEPEPEAAIEPAITLGVANGVASPVRIDLESLRKHVVIFAGSGSGKTVLMRRIVEECALRGVSAIVLDPNNDLARLGEGWPSPPEQWADEDERVAREYLANTDVVVWTPGRTAGRPLSFHPLPDFAGVLDDEDEFAAAVEASVATLAPHARIAGTTKAASRSKAVLREALTYYARTGSRSLTGFIDVLAELPDGVSQLGSGVAIAADLAETLRAAMVNDPLFGGTGEPADPAVLFTPAAGKRARISVISFVGLPSEEQRQGFVNQLQMEVFAWIKRNPAGERPLGGLLVMDEAQTLAPSGASTASTHSTIMLASQARKYGLGLLFATQAPKGLHNQIAGNATTQFYGRLNSPAQIDAANDMARAKGSSVGDISQLERGQFYVTGETFGFRRLQAPLCLSHHPASPLRLEEVIERARDGSA